MEPEQREHSDRGTNTEGGDQQTETTVSTTEHLFRQRRAERDDGSAAEQTAGQTDHHAPHQRIGADEPQPVDDVAVGRAPVDAPRRVPLFFRKVEMGDEPRRQQEAGAVGPDRERRLVRVEEVQRVEVAEPLRDAGQGREEGGAERKRRVRGDEPERVGRRELIGLDDVGHRRVLRRAPHQREDLDQERDQHQLDEVVEERQERRAARPGRCRR